MYIVSFLVTLFCTISAFCLGYKWGKIAGNLEAYDKFYKGANQ